MMTIVVGSVRSAGATTVALAIAGWLDPVVLVEADPDGGVLALRYGLRREPGLLTLAASRDLEGDMLSEHTQRLPGGLPVIVAPESPARTLTSDVIDRDAPDPTRGARFVERSETSV